MTLVTFVPEAEFARVASFGLPPVRATALFASLCRINTLYMIARAGSGHIGSSFSSLDIVSWLYLNELRDEDCYFSSKGHDVPGLYAVLIARGILPFETVHMLRRLGGLPGHPDVDTPGMVTNTGPLGMGISKAKGMVLANRLSGRTGRIFVMTGDGELQEGQLWESLASAATQRLAEITVVVDHNKIQSDTWVESVSSLGDLRRKFEAFGWYAIECDGHDLAALGEAFRQANGVTDRPKVIIAHTVKGRGVRRMEHTAMTDADRFYRFHSGAPDDATYSEAVAELLATANGMLAEAGASPLAVETVSRPERPSVQGAQRLVGAYARALVAQAERHPRLVALDADLILDCGLIPFAERFPERFIECGIAEQDMVSQAGGLALRGALPVVHSFACFLSTRPNEQIYNNATERRKILYVAPLAGVLPGGPGHSHQSVRDISALAAMPGLEMIQPSCEDEVAMALAYAIESAPESAYLRLVSIPCHIPYRLPDGYRLERGRGVALTAGEDAVLFAYGPVMLAQAWHAAARLAEQDGLGLRVINLPWLNQVDADWLRTVVGECRAVFTLDDHYVTGGQGEMIAARLAGVLAPGSAVYHFGLRDIPACGQNDEVLRAHRLDAESIAADVRAALGVVARA